MANSGTVFNPLGAKISSLWKSTKWFKTLIISCIVFIPAAAVVIPNALIRETGGIFHKCDISIENIDANYLYSAVNCTEKAKYYYSCACGNKGSELFEYGNPLGHDLVHHEGQQVTCIEIGYNKHDTCSRCDYSTYDEIPATGHTDGDWITDKNATCTEDGSKHQICSVCDTTIKTETITKLGHTDGEWITDKIATCTQNGSKHQVCLICTDIIKTVAIPATGHTNGNWFIDANATCTEKGLKHQECSVCYEKINEVQIEQLGHIDSDWIYDSYPTCTKVGQRHKICARCKNAYDNESVKAKGHTPGSAVTENKVDATCDVKGHYDSVVYCTVNSCNAEISRTKKDISPIGHTYVSYLCKNCGVPQSGVNFIYDLEDLQNISNNRSATYALMKDIDCKWSVITPIGTDNTAPFSGVFDGCGHTISNYIASNAQYIGIFGYSTGIIRNLNVKNFDFDIVTNSFEKMTVGGIVGYNAGVIEKCSVINGDIYISSTSSRLGALLCGESIGTIKNCFATGNVYVTQPSPNKSGSFAAGITAFNYGTIEKCFVDATLYCYGKNDGYSVLGGGGSYGEAAFITTVSGTNSTISDCFVMGSISTANNRVGDISGYCYSGVQITNCYKDENLVLCSSNNVHSNATAISLSTMSGKNFFNITLKWDSSIWNYTSVNLANKVYPKLKQN